jgi:hypothetical protein
MVNSKKWFSFIYSNHLVIVLTDKEVFLAISLICILGFENRHLEPIPKFDRIIACCHHC